MNERGRGSTPPVDVLVDRAAVLDRLVEQPGHVRDLVDETDLSRSTVNRAINDLEDADLVERTDEGYAATTAGRFALDGLRSFRATLDDVLAAEPVTNPLPVDGMLDRTAVVGGETSMATEPNPYRALERFHDDLEAATRYCALLPAVDDPRHVRLLYEHVVTHDRPADLVAASQVVDALRAEFPRRAAGLADSQQFSLSVGDVPPFLLALVDRDRDGQAVHVVVFNDSGSVHGAVANETDAAVRWAEDTFDRAREGADERTGALQATSDGGPVAVDPGDRAVGDQSLPVPLEREGFVRLDVSYFREEPVADPTTAWRAGLTLPEVHTGYAVERGLPDGSTETAAADPTAMADALGGDLAAGQNCIVLGPPGSGKSTVCKRVACDWYDDDRGPVLYREGGRGRRFGSVDDLVSAVESASGHALVVVEDAVRPEAADVFEAIRRLDGRDGVSFLLDARESEWRDPPGEPGRVPELTHRHVPSLSGPEWERVVEHVERTVGESVSVPLDRLRASVRAETVGDEDSVTGAMLLLLHRLATYVDPLAEARTSLEASVADCYEDLAGDDIALDVCVLANTLNAAGLEIDAGALYAVADPSAYEAVDAAIERLDGHVLFPRDDGTYRSVHETWSATFLAHLLGTAGGRAAAERFGDCVGALLALADDPGQREAIASHLDDRWALSAAAEDPSGWADATVEAIFALGRERPKLAPLFGDGAQVGVELPDACSEPIHRRQWWWFAAMFDDANQFDAAREVARAGLSAVPERSRTACRLLGIQARTLAHQGDADGARELIERQRDVATELGAEDLEADAVGQLGYVAHLKGEYERGRDRKREALDVAESLGDRKRAAELRKSLGLSYLRVGDYEPAEACFEASLAEARELGLRQLAANCRGNLGWLAHRRGDYERSSEHITETLETYRAIGDRMREATGLTNLGELAHKRGEYDAAREYQKRSIEIVQEIGERWIEIENLIRLGRTACMRGEYDRAREYHERALDIAREVGDERRVAASLVELGTVDRLLGKYDRAGKHLEEALDVARTVDHPVEQIESLVGLAALVRERGDLDRASRRLDDAAVVSTDDAFENARVTLERARLALARGDAATSREYAKTARERFAELGATHWTARSRALVGRAALDEGDTASARETLEAALETFEAVGAPQDALAALSHLLDVDDGETNWSRRTREVFADAPSAVVARHRQLTERIHRP